MDVGDIPASDLHRHQFAIEPLNNGRQGSTVGAGDLLLTAAPPTSERVVFLEAGDRTFMLVKRESAAVLEREI